MTIFSYTAFKKDNTSVRESGKIEASNITEARANLRQKGLVPLSLVADNPASLGGKKAVDIKNLNSTTVLPSLSLNQKIDLTTTIHALLTAGVPIIEALIFVENDVDNKRIQKVCHVLRKSIITGSTFASAVAKHPNVFDKVYVGLIKAGEDSGEMEDTMGRLIELLKKQQTIKSKVIGALTYPAFLILIAITAVVILLTFVFPAFEGMFAQLNITLPLPTRICMEAGKFMKGYWWAIVIILSLLGGGIFAAFRIETSKRFIDTYSLKIPLISGLLVQANLSNFLSVLQVSYDAGIPIVECLRLAGLTLDNYHLKESVSKAIIKVQQGVHLSTALRSTNTFPSLIMFLMGAGEQSGQLGDMLNHCVVQIDKRLDDVIDRMTKLIEPIMLVIMGGVVLFIALSLYLPLFKSYSGFAA